MDESSSASAFDIHTLGLEGQADGSRKASMSGWKVPSALDRAVTRGWSAAEGILPSSTSTVRSAAVGGMQITRSFFSGHQAQLDSGRLSGTTTRVRPALRSILGLASAPIIMPKRPLVSFRMSLLLALRS